MCQISLRLHAIDVSASSVHWSHSEATSYLAFTIVIVNCSHMRNNSNIFFNTLVLARSSLLAKICWDSGLKSDTCDIKMETPCCFVSPNKFQLISCHKKYIKKYVANIQERECEKHCIWSPYYMYLPNIYTFSVS